MVEGEAPRTTFRVISLQEPQELVWAKADSTWARALKPGVDEGTTRLVTRLRQRYDWHSPGTVLSIGLLEIADFPMMRRMLLGIKDRAENLANQCSITVYARTALGLRLRRFVPFSWISWSRRSDSN